MPSIIFLLGLTLAVCSSGSPVPSPDGSRHMFVLIHGFNGEPSDMSLVSFGLQKGDFKREAAIVVLADNTGVTGKGIEFGANRIYEQIMEAQKKSKATHLSIIAHSLGGVYGRYLVGLLYKNDKLVTDLSDTDGRMHAVDFITIVSPHMGSRHHIPFSTSVVVNPIVRMVSKVVLKPTLSQLMIEDKGKLLVQMSTGHYKEGLKLFSNLVNYASVRSDKDVHYSTAAIRLNNFWNEDTFLANAHDEIYFIDEQNMDDVTSQIVIAKSEMTVNDAMNNDENEIHKNLSELPWKRIAVVPSKKFSGHTDVIGKETITSSYETCVPMAAVLVKDILQNRLYNGEVPAEPHCELV